MQPVQGLLHRIRWDRTYGDADFEVGYYDRVEDRIILVPFAKLSFPTDDHSVFEFLDKRGGFHRVPLHRVREIRRNSRCVWRRQHS
jgi:uncharacterized protein (UPF0248 family)